MPTFDVTQLRQAFGRFITGVTVVTTTSRQKIPVGFTANSFTSVSLEPPLLLVCPAKTMASFDCFAECSHFAINILAEEQQEIANIFALSQDDRFATIDWHTDNYGSPLLAGTIAYFSCSVHNLVDGGDHGILIGQVEELQVSDTNINGLGYSSSGYFGLGMERAAHQPNNRKMKVGVIIEHNGKILIQKEKNGYSLPHIHYNGNPGSLTNLIHYLETANLKVTIGVVYSVFENKTTGELFIYYLANAEDDQCANLGSYIEIESIPLLRFASKADGSMMQRYVMERKNQLFGMYLGDDIHGTIHTLNG